MELKELSELIKIREYVANSVATSTIERKTITELNNLLLLIDKKIITLLLGDEFKEYVDYKNVQEAKEAAVRITNIYAGIEDRKKKYFNPR
jgi:hypothetical protein